MLHIKQLMLLVLLGASYVLAQDAGRRDGDTPEQSYPHCSSQKFTYGEHAQSIHKAASFVHCSCLYYC
jgi:hypothetical protein